MSQPSLKKKMFQTIKEFISLPQQPHSVKLVIDHQVEVVAVVILQFLRQADVVILVRVFQLQTVSYLLKDTRD